MAEQVIELLGTPGCHLCDEAREMLERAARARNIDWQYVDIAGDDALVACYGERIPVLRMGDMELGWPFSLLDLIRMVERGAR